MTVALSRELANRRIRVTAIAPGAESGSVLWTEIGERGTVGREACVAARRADERAREDLVCEIYPRQE